MTGLNATSAFDTPIAEEDDLAQSSLSSLRVSGLNLTEAQELLDWLENHGCTRLEIQCQSETGFAVSCACPPGLKLGRDEWGALHLLPA